VGVEAIEESIAHAFSATTAIVAFWMFPVAAAALCSTRLTLQSKLAWGSVWVAAALLAYRAGVQVDAFAIGVAGLLFYAVVCASVYRVAQWYGEGRVSRAALAILAVFSFLLLPVFLHERGLRAAFLALGWKLAFASYSYCVDGFRTPARLRDCMFFLWVDPALVFADRARPSAGAKQPLLGMLRAGAGAGVMFVAVVIDATEAVAATTRLPIVSAACIAFAQIYCAHSGLASIQIGLLRALGYRAQERYDHPYLAKDPADFWRRWNIYVGAWLRRYVFIPVVRELNARRTLGRNAVLVRAVAYAAAFGVAGIAHDLAMYTHHGALSLRLTGWFLAAAATSLVWSGTATALARLVGAHLRPRAATAIVSRAAFVAVLLGMMTWYH
jgi:hypothetical protein